MNSDFSNPSLTDSDFENPSSDLNGLQLLKMTHDGVGVPCTVRAMMGHVSA